MARLTEAALQNETFRKLFTTERYTVPATNCHPQGFTMHSTLLSQLDGTELHRGRILGGKTGYTMLAGNTLVTCAEKNGMKLITVILNGHQTHYSDTKALLDFGFSNFQSVNIADADGTACADEQESQTGAK